jgi:hypothetical protein
MFSLAVCTAQRCVVFMFQHSLCIGARLWTCHETGNQMNGLGTVEVEHGWAIFPFHIESDILSCKGELS